MSAEAIKKLQESQSEHSVKIQSLEKTIENVFPPLLAKLDTLTDRLHENSESINLHIQKSTSQGDSSKEAFERVRVQQEKLENSIGKVKDNLTTLKNEVIENRPVLKVVAGLGNRLIVLAVVIVAAASAIIMSK